MTFDPPDPSPRPTVAAPTLADVARRANVSTATVSRCLNSPDRVIPDTRERVMEAVRELGYAPNFNARALAAGRTNTIGAIIPTMENAIFARGLQAFQEELVRHGFTLFVASSAYQEDLEADQIRSLVARGADALLLIGFHRSEEVYEFLRRRRVPMVVAWAYDAARPEPAIGFDNAGAMAALARQVLQQGHRNIGFISAPVAANDRARERVEGVRRAMAEAGLDPARMTLIETAYEIENGATALRGILAEAPATTAVLCGNDVLAVGALRAAKELGLRVPDDLSITGFDDIELAGLAEPALTTVHVPHREMGRRAARMLIGMVDGSAPAKSVE
ncbi:MAG: LacI family DNA-binding transcriptional regulator, partial [Pseudomonadota bacterium]